MSLQRTWAEYKAAEHAPQSNGAGLVDTATTDMPRSNLVTAEELVEGFGEGYGDMSEALACLQQELSESANPAAVRIGELMVLLPLVATEDSLPTPALAWQQAVEWGVTNSSLIAVDITAPCLERERVHELTELWMPATAGRPPATTAEGTTDRDAAACKGTSEVLGTRYHLVALVCFQFNLQHYVAFCRRQRDPSKCMFFDDLPELTQGIPRETEWLKVPELCSQYLLTPRLALYECSKAAECAAL